VRKRTWLTYVPSDLKGPVAAARERPSVSVDHLRCTVWRKREFVDKEGDAKPHVLDTPVSDSLCTTLLCNALLLLNLQ
jgi:hypothetical protein